MSGGQKLLVSEFHSVALPGLAWMAPYHSYLEPQTQQRIVRCLLKYGMGESLLPRHLVLHTRQFIYTCSWIVCSSSHTAAVHQRAHDLHARNAGDNGEDVAGGAARPVQDIRHEGHCQPHAGVLIQ